MTVPKRRKWAVFATAPDQITAEMWRDLLHQTGIHCEVRPGDTSRFMGVGAIPVRLVTLEDEVEKAKAALKAQLEGVPDEEGDDTAAGR
jgi:hypothetical protein